MIIPNTIYFSRKLKEQYPHIAREIETKLKEEGVKPKWLDQTNDIWARDYMPLQIYDTYFIHYTYYPDYLMHSLEDRASITNPIRLEQKVLICEGKEVVNLPLILDGGNAVITDRHVIMTEKVLAENCRDRYSNENAVSNQIRKKMKLEPLFIHWNKKEKYGHTDWLVRYLGGPTNMVIVATNEEMTMDASISAIRKLSEAQCYDVREFKLDNPTLNSWAYLNYVQINNIVLMPTVAEPINDANAKEKLSRLFKEANQEVKIITIDCQDLIKAGGALHCISWNIKM